MSASTKRRLYVVGFSVKDLKSAGEVATMIGNNPDLFAVVRRTAECPFDDKTLGQILPKWRCMINERDPGPAVSLEVDALNGFRPYSPDAKDKQLRDNKSAIVTPVLNREVIKAMYPDGENKPAVFDDSWKVEMYGWEDDISIRAGLDWNKFPRFQQSD